MTPLLILEGVFLLLESLPCEVEVSINALEGLLINLFVKQDQKALDLLDLVLDPGVVAAVVPDLPVASRAVEAVDLISVATAIRNLLSVAGAIRNFEIDLERVLKRRYEVPWRI